ncbi:MAG: DUF4276 family protein [Phenylobacterium sp.]|nr:MAG: DUF4276 family protein [Phenylobacterium sp.]
MKIAVILEGGGDAQAVPCLITKTAQIMGMAVFAPHPIESGGIHKLSRPGQLERFVELAASRGDIEQIFIVVDLDDGCAAEMQVEFLRRIREMPNRPEVDVSVCFCVREYECWFLHEMETLRALAPDYEWRENFDCGDPSSIRDAKGKLNEAMSKHYKPMTDQLKLTQKLNLYKLYNNSRSFRKFVRALSGLDYELIDTCFR